MMKSVIGAAAIVVLAVGCETTPGNETPGICNAADYQSLIGSNIAAITLPSDLVHRIIGPGDAYTQDYSASRLNLFTDEDGTVIRVTCG